MWKAVFFFLFFKWSQCLYTRRKLCMWSKGITDLSLGGGASVWSKKTSVWGITELGFDGGASGSTPWCLMHTGACAQCMCVYYMVRTKPIVKSHCATQAGSGRNTMGPVCIWFWVNFWSLHA